MQTWDEETQKTVADSVAKQTFKMDSVRGSVAALVVVARDDADVSSAASTGRNTFNFREIGTFAMRADNEKLVLEQSGEYNRERSVQDAYAARVLDNIYTAVWAHAPQATGAQTGYFQAGTIRSLTVEATMPAAWSGSTGKLDVLSQRVNAVSLNGDSKQLVMQHG